MECARDISPECTDNSALASPPVSFLASLSVLELLDRVDADPQVIRDEASRRLSSEGAVESAQLHWVIGMCEREIGNLDRAATEMESGVVLADQAADFELAAKIKMSLGFVVGRHGDLDRALDLFDTAGPFLRGADRARLANQRGLVFYWRGEFVRAADELGTACRALRRHGDRVGEVRTRVSLGAVLGQLREYRAAERNLREAILVASEIGQHRQVAMAHHNLGYLAMIQGDLPAALDEFEQAEQRHVAAGIETELPRLYADHAQALADAALFDDAEALLRRALQMLQAHGNEIEMAGVLVTAAEIRLAQRDVAGARQAAVDAAKWYRKQGREGWVAISTSLALQAAARAEDRPPELAQSLDEVAMRLVADKLGAEATRARLVAAQIRAESGDDLTFDPVAPATRRSALRGPAADRILLAHVDAIAAQRRDDRAAARRAITRGLNVAMANQAALGSIETRAHAAVHGSALTEIGARVAVADRRPRELLARIESTRLMSSRTPALRPPADPELARLLTELRNVAGQLADPATSDEDRRAAEHEHSRLEREVRRRSRAVRGDDTSDVRLRREIATSLALLGDRQLVAHARLDGRLYAVSITDGRARLHDLGPLDEVSDRIDAVTFSLIRLNRSQGSEESRLAAAEMLYGFADELAEIVLPPIVAGTMEPVVIVPTAVLHDVPWGLLPPLAGRSVSVNSSVSAWGHAERTLRERRHTLLDGIEAGFVAGPGLDYAELEVEQLAIDYVDPVVLTGASANVDACTKLLSTSELVHIACHGSFRRDNPMFSSLHVADGPLNVYDLERIERLPAVVVLSSCSVANAKVLQGGSLLGLANAFTTLGAASVIAPLTPISDASSVTVMQRLHRHMIAGATPAAALAAATMSHDVADPTAAAFIALGA
jgi:CHAT domain-containing protein/tetratricopeptide (TPR) repeat protein